MGRKKMKNNIIVFIKIILLILFLFPIYKETGTCTTIFCFLIFLSHEITEINIFINNSKLKKIYNKVIGRK